MTNAQKISADFSNTKSLYTQFDAIFVIMSAKFYTVL